MKCTCSMRSSCGIPFGFSVFNAVSVLETIRIHSFLFDLKIWVGITWVQWRERRLSVGSMPLNSSRYWYATNNARSWL